MNINVLDRSFKKLSVFDSFKSLLWNKRYYDIGALDLQVEASAENIALFQRGNYITRDDDDAVYRIEAIELDTNENADNSLIVGAYDCKKIFSQRLILPRNYNTTLESLIGLICSLNITHGASSERQIAAIESGVDFEDVAEIQTAYQYQSNYETLSEKIIELCRENSLGWRVYWKPTEGRGTYLKMGVYKGKDRSAAQSALPPVVFSPTYESLNSSKYSIDDSEEKNVALVAGEGEGNERKKRWIGTETGIDRDEVLIESSLTTKSVEGDLVDYYEALISEGKGKLSEMRAVQTFEGEVDTSQYVYKTDYDLGDIVTIENEYGLRANARIVEITETWDNEGYSIEPIFDFTEDEEGIDNGILTEADESLLTEMDEGLATEI